MFKVEKYVCSICFKVVFFSMNLYNKLKLICINIVNILYIIWKNLYIVLNLVGVLRLVSVVNLK